MISKETVDNMNKENNRVVDMLTKYIAQLIRENSELRYKLNQISDVLEDYR